MPRQFFVGGNFKMNPASLAAKRSLLSALAGAELDPATEVVVAPPALYLLPAQAILRSAGSPVKLAAQNCSQEKDGAFTGEISPLQLADAEIPYVILGHSERRTLFGESSALVAAKTRAALAAGLRVILCVGETLAEREAGSTLAVVSAQLRAAVDVLDAGSWEKVVVAYEPVWAIGTGKVASAAQAQEVHKEVRAFLAAEVTPGVADATRVIYGGSVSAKNCAELAAQPDIDGFLVGGASLKPEFVQIVNVNRK
ncbi:Triosephosphate isomerase [Phellopilus nigrolimitatus]|nr:Triosephosphate isomerase [Phellopilus nigrolimitatus]